MIFTDKEIKKKIAEGLQNVIEESSNIERYFVEDFYELGLNSLDRIRLIVELEQLFDIEIDDDDDYTEENFKNMDTVVEVIKKYL